MSLEALRQVAGASPVVVVCMSVMAVIIVLNYALFVMRKNIDWWNTRPRRGRRRR
jgi:hypothetical protein